MARKADMREDLYCTNTNPSVNKESLNRVSHAQCSHICSDNMEDNTSENMYNEFPDEFDEDDEVFARLEPCSLEKKMVRMLLERKKECPLERADSDKSGVVELVLRHVMLSIVVLITLLFALGCWTYMVLAR